MAKLNLQALGSFEVTLEPQVDDTFPVGRMTIDKVYSGDLVGTGKGQMLSKRSANFSAYTALEEFAGEVNGKKGGFTLIHHGFMMDNSHELDIFILSGSGTGELEDISGRLDIKQDDGEHTYELEYSL